MKEEHKKRITRALIQWRNREAARSGRTPRQLTDDLIEEVMEDDRD